MKALLYFSLFILALMLFTGQADAQEKKINKIYLKNGSVISCNDAWISGDKSDAVCYVRGNKGLRISLVEVDKEKTFGTERNLSADQTIVTRQEKHREQQPDSIINKKAAWREAICSGANNGNIAEYAEGIDINESIDDEGNTPLHVAAISGNIILAQFLVQNGADPEAKNIHGETPLDMAEKEGHPCLVDYLRDPHYKNQRVAAVPQSGLDETHLQTKEEERDYNIRFIRALKKDNAEFMQLWNSVPE